MKGKVIALIAMLVIAFSTVTVSAVPKFTAHCDNQNKIITGEIQIQDNAPDDLLVYLIDETGMNNVLCIEEITGNEGIYNISMNFDENASEGWYLLIIEDYESTDDASIIPLADRSKRMYVAPTKINEALSAINGATKETIGEKFVTYSDVLNLDITTDYTEALETIFIAMKDAEQGHQFTLVSRLAEVFSLSKASGAVYEATAGTMETMLNKYSQQLGIDMSEDYAKYPAEIHEIFCGLLKGIMLDKDTPVSIKKSFEEAVAVAAINNGNRESITGILEKYSSKLGITLSSNYYKYAIEANKALERKGFKNKEEIQTALTARVNQLINENTAGGGTGGGGGGGGGGTPSIGYTPPQPETPSPDTEQFKDLASVSWAKDAINFLAEKNIISGYGNGDFRPQNNVKREEFIKMLVSAYGWDKENAEYKFLDGDSTAWYAPYIAVASEKGIVSGYEDGTVGIGKMITRQEMATMVFRAAGFEEELTSESFTDHNEISDFAKNAIYTLRKKKIIAGMEDGRFAPNENSTRAEAAVMLYKLIGGDD